jgi:hypothetical protein
MFVGSARLGSHFRAVNCTCRIFRDRVVRSDRRIRAVNCTCRIFRDVVVRPDRRIRAVNCTLSAPSGFGTSGLSASIEPTCASDPKRTFRELTAGL